MQKFIPQNHKEIDNVVKFYMIVFAIIVLVFLWFNWKVLIVAILISLPLFFMGLFPLFRKFGLYIDNDKIVFKRFLQKQLDVKDVAGLLILKSEYRTRYSYHYMKNKDKSFRYSIIYLKEVDTRFADFNLGDIRFMSNHREDAYFYTVYDEEVIDFFKGKIPITVCK